MSGECILVIDDSKEIVKHLTQRILPTFGYKTIHAADGKTGLQLIREKSPDLVMLDYNLPKMTGIDVLQHMAQESLNTPVVLMTGYGSELSAIEAFRLGAKDYLIKPFTIDEIIETIDRALLEKRLLHDKEKLAEQLRRVKVEISRQTHQMNTLFNIGKAITSLLSVDKVLERVLEAASYLTNAEESTIWLPDETNTYLQAYEKKGNDTKNKEPSLKVHIAEFEVGQVMSTGLPSRQSVFSGKGIEVAAGYFARAILYVPLKLRGVTMGVLGVSNNQALRSFSKRDEFLLSFLADYAAIALENARVFQAADQALAARLEELGTLIEITRMITSSLDLDEVVRLTIKQVHDSWDIEASSLWLLDEKKQVLKVLANVGTPADILSQIEVPVGRGIAGHVAETGKWTYTNDVATHPLHYRHVDSTTGFKTRSVLCVPLTYRGQIIGVMQLLNKRNGDFDDQDVERALSIATAVAIAVTNALLFKEAEIRKQHLEATLEHSDNPILITDANHNLHLLNQQARKRLGLTADAVGCPVAEVIDSPQLAKVLTHANPEKRSRQQEHIVLDDGSIWAPRIAPVPGHGHILILQDITNLKELEEAKDLFVATVSHDMRSPLNSISGFAANLGEAGPLNEQQELFVNHITAATERMMSQINGLLELAKVNTRLERKQQSCNIIEITQKVVNEFQGQALTKGIDLNLEIANDSSIVEGDPNQLHSALSNLVDNAIKYSPADHPVQITVSDEAANVLIAVTDHGKGIAAKDLPHIFDIFYRGYGNNGVGGVGLGLALVQSIVETHGGEVWVESKEGHGSTFYLRLPTRREKIADAERKD